MPVASNLPPKTWRIEAFRDLDHLFRIDVPSHRLSDKGVFPLLKTIILRYEPLSPEELVSAMLNKRSGGPLGLQIQKPSFHINAELERLTWTAFGPTVTAMAYSNFPNGKARLAEMGLSRQDENSRRGP